MKTWRDSILKQFVPQISKLSLVSDPDNLLTEEKMSLALRKQGFDILEFNNAIEFRYAYESRYRVLWDAGSATELVVILHTKEIDLGNLPYDLLEAGKKFYFNIDDLFPVFSPHALGVFDRNLLDFLFSFRDLFPTEKMGDKASIDFLLRYVYKIDSEAINNELDLIKALMYVHYAPLRIPQLYFQRFEEVLSDKTDLKSLPIKPLLYDKEYFTAYLVEKHEEVINTSPEVQLTKIINTGYADIEKLFTYLEEYDISLAFNHRDWIYVAWKFAHLTSFIFKNNYTQYFKRIHFLYMKINNPFEQWICNNLSGLRTIPAVTPAMVHHIPHYISSQYKQNGNPSALLVFDGMSLDQWITLRDSLDTDSFLFDENALFSWVPTLTSVSRQAIFSGKSPYEYGDYIHTTSREEAYWSLFWENNGLPKQSVAYRKNIDASFDTDVIEKTIIPHKTIVAGFVLNTIDNIMHGMKMGMAGFHNQIKIFGGKTYLNSLITKLFDYGYDIYIVSDHGNTECEGEGFPEEGSIAKSRGERVRVYQSEALMQSVENRFPWSLPWKPIGLPDGYYPLVAKGVSAFLPKNTQAVSHGGISIKETIVPFIKVFRKQQI
jgi:hypothetical protein